ncbi:GD12174 [Drosophila simulans]|uniref:GD12174 n=1 Tax=Drosophila simulans TaxID=7240 RepID=B4QJ52_DROSI|nr:GD12174 [Drosophila simulans]
MADLKAKLKRNRKAAETSTRPTLNSRKEPAGKTAIQQPTLRSTNDLSIDSELHDGKENAGELRS